ncbi:MAG: hypothetical protein V3S51_07505 [Dehalococcoidia bacterium]
MSPNISIIPRLRRFRRNLAASLDEEGDRFSTATRRTSHSLRRLGRSITSSLDATQDYLDDDPVGAFLEGAKSGPDLTQGDEGKAPELPDILASPPKFDSQNSEVPGPPQAQSQPQSPAESPIPALEVPTPPESDSQNSGVPSPVQDQGQLQSPAESSPLEDILVEPSVNDSQGDAVLPQDQATEMPAVASFEALSPEIDTLDTDVASPPPAKSPPQSSTAPSLSQEFGEEPPVANKQEAPGLGPDAEAGMTAMTNNEPLDLGVDENIAPESLPSGESSQTQGGDADSLLDLFRSEDIEVDPITEMAKGLPDIEIRHLVDKVNQMARELKGET